MLLVRAALTLAFGIIALASPGIALLALVYVFGFYAILEGIAAIAFAVRARASLPHWGWLVAEGVVSVLAGLVALFWPGLTALTLLFVVAIWAVVLGVAQIAEGFAGRRRGDASWGWAVVGGVINILFGILLMVWPASGILALLWLIGIFAVVAGIAGIVRAFRVRGTPETTAGPPEATPAAG
jgi:uncharacterized membrane protein HdeD (DUF308 family)